MLVVKSLLRLKRETRVRIERNGAMADGLTYTNEIARGSKGDINRAR